MPTRIVQRGRDQALVCPVGWSTSRKNARGVAVQSAVHACTRANGHTGQHVCRCGVRRQP